MSLESQKAVVVERLAAAALGMPSGPRNPFELVQLSMGSLSSVLEAAFEAGQQSVAQAPAEPWGVTTQMTQDASD